MNEQDEGNKIIDATFYYPGTFRQYLTELLQGIDAETDDRFHTLANKNVKYLFLRYNKFAISRDLPTVSIRHSRISSGMTVFEEVQNRNWQYLISYLIEKVERGESLKVKTTKE